MIRPIMRDMMFLAAKSEPVTQADRQTALDLLDTLRANREHCVGMAANMIGVRKRIIAVSIDYLNIVMFNPVIMRRRGEYEAEEGCLSLSGVRRTKRYETIEVEYQDMEFKKRKQVFTGWTAQIIQHEVDHCDGILI